MKKSAATLDSLQTGMDSIEINMDRFGVRMDSIEINMDRFGVRMDSIETRAETISKTLLQIQTNAERLEENQERTQANTERLEANQERIKANLEDLQANVEFLVGHAVTREEVSEIIDKKLEERLVPMESRLLSAMDFIAKDYRTKEQEVTIIRYNTEQLDRRVGIIETVLKL